jgi:hypothetical protein
MEGFKVVFTFSDGEIYDSYDEAGEYGFFETEEDAEDYAMAWLSNYDEGGEVLNLSNPGDYPLETVQEEPDYEIVELVIE